MRPARIAVALVGVTLTMGTGAASAAPVSFTPLPGSPYFTPPPKDRAERGSNGDPSVVEIGRLDGDTRLDAASFGSGLRALVAPADPLASPFAKTSLADYSEAGQLAIVDADDDGDRDIVTVGASSSKTWLGDGSGEFEERDDASQPDNTSAVVARFDGDAYPDLVLVTAAGRELIPGTPDGDFSGDAVIIEGTGSPAPTVQAAGDTDGDGDQDVVGAGPGFIRILRNDGGSAFTALAATGVAGTPAAVTAADLDEDGHADPVALMEDGRVVVVRSHGGVTDVASGLAAAPANAGSVRAADFDGDAHLDLVAGNASAGGSTLRVLTGTGTGGFSCGPQGVPAPVFGAFGGLAVGDLSGDGLADIAVSSFNGSQVDLLRNTTAVTTAEAEIALPFRSLWVSEAPFTAALNGQASDVEWDFGEGRTWTEADLADPECQSFVPDPGGAVHAYPAVFAPKSTFTPQGSPFDPLESITEGVALGVDGTVPPTAPAGQSEVRRTYLVRARFTTPSGAKAIIARHVVVRPDTPPRPIATLAQGDKIEYSGPTIFFNDSVDADDVIDPERDSRGRDKIVLEEWDFGDGSPNLRQPPGQVVHDFFATRLAGRPPLTALDPQGDAVAQAAAVEAQAQALNAAGPANWSGAQRVTLTVTDRSGRTATKDFAFPHRARTAPRPAFSVAGTTKTGGGEKLPDPIIAGKTAVKLDLRGTGVDPNGTAAFHVLRIGQPAPAPCPVLEAKKCKGGKPPNLRPAKVALGKPAVYPTVVVSEEQLAKDNGIVPLVFPKASPEGKPWSVQHTVYDETGAVGRSRYDGFVVETPDAKCQKIQGREVGPAKLVFSGACVDTYDDKRLFASSEPVTLNGLTVRPPAGKLVIVAACGKGRVVVFDQLPALRRCGYTIDLQKSPSAALEVLSGSDVVGSITKLQQGFITRASFDGRGIGLLPAERYQGFPLSGSPELTFASGKSSKGTLKFHVAFPKELAPAGTTNTGETTVIAYDVPREVIVTEFDGFAARVKARVAATPPAPKIASPDSLMLGPINLAEIGAFTYDAATDTFTASAKDVPIPVGAAKASLSVALRNGALVRAEGKVDGLEIFITPVVKLTGFAFTIEPISGGLVLSGTADFSDTTGKILTGSGTVTSTLASDFALSITGSAKLVELLPVRASLSYSGAGVKFAAGTGYSFGPVSFSAEMGGAFAGKGFQISGSGRACLFVCLKITGLASERALAGCGSVDLVLTTITAGFGYVFGDGIDVFAGSCNLSPYGSAAAFRRAAGPDGTYTVPIRPVSDSISISVGSPGPLRPGASPQVQVFNSDNVLVAQTTTELGGSSATGNLPGPAGEAYRVYVEQDADAGLARFLIPKPRLEDGGFKGPYTVKPVDGGVALSEPEVEYGDPPLETAVKGGSVDLLTAEQKQAVTDGQVPIVGMHPSNPPVTGGAVVAGPVSLPGTVSPSSLQPAELDRLRLLNVTGKLPPGQTITFQESNAGTTGTTQREIGTTTANADGDFAFTGVFAPSSFVDFGTDRCVTGFVQTGKGVPRGPIARVACYQGKPPSIKRPQLLFDLKRFGPKKVRVDVSGFDASGWTQAAVLQVRKGPVSRALTVSPNLILGLRGQSLSRRAQRQAPPVAKQDYAFTIDGLPAGKAPIRVLVAGVNDPRDTGKVSRLKATIRRGEKGLKLNTGAKGKKKVKHVKAKKSKCKKGKKGKKCRKGKKRKKPGKKKRG